jgi:hypothetical protein
MNLFILDIDPVIAAEMNCDRHVCKIIIESAQMLCLGHWATGSQAEYYARTHMNNHVSKWVRENKSNYRWTISHGLSLCDEYTRRYSKVHAVRRIIEWCRDNEPKIPDGDLTAFRQAVAEDCYNPDPVYAYHLYYVKYKSYFAKWKLGNIPEWYINMSSKLTASTPKS